MPSRSLRRLCTVSLAIALPSLTSCAPAPRSVADWRSLDALVGSWECDAHFRTPQGALTVPMVTLVTRSMSGRFLQIHREAPGWDASTGRFIEDEYTGWDRKRSQWVTTVANNFGVSGYLTSSGFHDNVAEWDEHPFTDVSLPLRARTVWRKLSPTEWTAEMRTLDLSPAAVALTSEHCLKKSSPTW